MGCFLFGIFFDLSFSHEYQCLGSGSHNYLHIFQIPTIKHDQLLKTQMKSELKKLKAFVVFCSVQPNRQYGQGTISWKRRNCDYRVIAYVLGFSLLFSRLLKILGLMGEKMTSNFILHINGRRSTEAREFTDKITDNKNNKLAERRFPLPPSHSPPPPPPPPPPWKLPCWHMSQRVGGLVSVSGCQDSTPPYHYQAQCLYLPSNITVILLKW